MKEKKDNKEQDILQEELDKKNESSKQNDTKEKTSKEQANSLEKSNDDKPEDDPEEKIKELEAQIADLKKSLLYKVAEFDNYRKRTLKEKTDLILNGGKKVIEALLPIADDLERAEASMENATEVEALKEGLLLIFQKFNKTLEGLGVKKMDALGQDFSTDFHEAVAFVPGGDDKKGKVIDCIQNGYTLNNQVIRYAKVAVGQ